MENLSEHLLNSLTGPTWKKIGIKIHHGINLHLSAVHSAHSAGIGEFFDLIPIIDWCRTLHLDVIQLLPLNSSDEDPSPYNANSSCAINFIHLSLHQLPHLDLVPEQQEKLKGLQELTKSQRVPYSQVLNQKLIWLRAYFSVAGSFLLQSQEFQDFMSHHSWVKPYALFRSLKDQLAHTPWTTWPHELRPSVSKEYEELLDIHQASIHFYSSLQYLCYLQLNEVHLYAQKNQIFLMGDIPILLSPDSADVWQYPEYFDINLAAGAPPDEYSQEGQYWGFPLFRWDVMRKTEFSWWKQRLSYASHFFDLYRLDHVTGFFRIWTIPLGHPSSEGYFLPADDHQGESQGRELLKMLAVSSPMLPIAEDLGSVHPVVPIILEEMGICGTKVMRWMHTSDNACIPIDRYPPISLTCLSTHDSPTLQQWWKQFPKEAQMVCNVKKWEYAPDLTIDQRRDILRDSHQTSSLFHINLLQEYLALFPELVWSNPDEERINIPGTKLPSNWTYRFRPSVEDLIAHEGLSSAIVTLIKSGK